MTAEKQSWQLDKRPRRHRFGRAAPRATVTSAVSPFRVTRRITDQKRGRSEVKRKKVKRTWLVWTGQYVLLQS